ICIRDWRPYEINERALTRTREHSLQTGRDRGWEYIIGEDFHLGRVIAFQPRCISIRAADNAHCLGVILVGFLPLDLCVGKGRFASDCDLANCSLLRASLLAAIRANLKMDVVRYLLRECGLCPT